MYDITQAQVVSEKVLIKQGFHFSNWISAQEQNENLGCMVFTKRKGGSTEYREIAPDGSVN
jgi:hypothetical protein